MYNRYINDSFADFFCPVEEEPQAEVVYEDVAPPERPARGELGLPLGLRLPELDADTLILLVTVCFLVAEEGESISDTLLIIGVLLLLGF